MRDESDGAPLGGRVLDAKSGEVLDAHEVARRILGARVILVGEEHGNPIFHEVQREVLELVAARKPGSVALGVEWLPRSARLALAGFGVATPPATLDELRRAVRWDELWGHELSAYARVLEAARRVRAPIVPLNAEPGLARLVARGGVDGVPPERQAELPPLDSGNDAHRAWFRERMQAAAHGHAAHALSDDAFEHYYLAQLLWDETMARAILEALAHHAHIVVCAGLGHVERGLGIPARLGATRHLIVIPVASASEAARRAFDGELPEREADLFWVPLTPPESPGSPRPDP